MSILLPVKVPTEHCTHIEVTVSHEAGGANFLSGTTNRRGIYCYATPVRIKDGMRTCVLFHGLKLLLEELPRKSAKKLEANTVRVQGEVTSRNDKGMVWNMILKVCRDEKVELDLPELAQAYRSRPMAREISNTDNILDSRDVIKRQEELNDEREALVETVQEASDALAELVEMEVGSDPAIVHDKAEEAELVLTIDEDGEKIENEKLEELQEAFRDATEELNDWDCDNKEELDALTALCEEGESNCSDWIHGEALIREDHFEDYCQELVKDIGDMPRNIPSYIEIDWSKTANNLKVDYTEIDYGGVTYLVRSS
jgi:hypothetical protein